MNAPLRPAVLAAWATLAAASPCAAEPASTWVLEVDLGKPSLESGDFALSGDASAGYATPTWGVAGRGAFGVWDAVDSGTSTQTVHDAGAVEGWYILGTPADPLRLEVRLAAGADLYSSTSDPGTTGRGAYHDETSLMRRATLLAGGRLRTPAWQAVLHLGAGVQSEVHDSLTTDPAQDLLRDEAQTSLRLEGRAVVRWALLPEQLSLRARAVATRFALTRSGLIVRQTGAVRRSDLDFVELDVAARLFVDVNAITVLGIVPAVFGGLDVVSVEGTAGSRGTVVPLFGVGLVKPEAF